MHTVHRILNLAWVNPADAKPCDCVNRSHLAPAARARCGRCGGKSRNAVRTPVRPVRDVSVWPAAIGHWSAHAGRATWRAVAPRPTHLNARLDLGRALLSDHRAAEALIEADAVRAVDPGNAHALVSRRARPTCGRRRNPVPRDRGRSRQCCRRPSPGQRAGRHGPVSCRRSRLLRGAGARFRICRGMGQPWLHPHQPGRLSRRKSRPATSPSRGSRIAPRRTGISPSPRCWPAMTRVGSPNLSGASGTTASGSTSSTCPVRCGPATTPPAAPS